MHCIECPRPVQARGLCNTHYSRARRALIDDGIDMFPIHDEARRVIKARPVTCRFRACVRPVQMHDVCADHLVATLSAGRRATLSRPQRRLALVTAERAARR